MIFVRAYPRETQEMVFDAHDRAFAFFKGVCARGIYDNMKTAVETVHPRAALSHLDQDRQTHALQTCLDRPRPRQALQRRRPKSPNATAPTIIPVIERANATPPSGFASPGFGADTRAFSIGTSQRRD
jgi:hypothetical protein